MPSNVPEALDDPSLSGGSMNLNGQRFERVSCAGSMNIFSGNPLGEVASHKTALDACAHGSARPRVHFAFHGGAVSDVRVADVAPAVARCIADEIVATHPSGEGACVATLVLGP